MSPDTKYEPNCQWQEHRECENGGSPGDAAELQMQSGDNNRGIAQMGAGTVIGLDQCRDYCMRGIANYPMGHELSSARTWCCQYDPQAANTALPTGAVCGLYTIESAGQGAPTTLATDSVKYALDMWNLKDCGVIASTSYKMIKLGEAIENLSIRLDVFRRMELSRTVQQVGEMDVSGSYSTLAYVGLALGLGLAGVGAVAYVMISEAPEKKGLLQHTDDENSDVSSSE